MTRVYENLAGRWVVPVAALLRGQTDDERRVLIHQRAAAAGLIYLASLIIATRRG